MTFTEIQNSIADRMNLTTTTALARIGKSINECYKDLASSIGIDTVERRTATATCTIGNRSLTFGATPVALQKLLLVYDATVNPVRILDERSMDELRKIAAGSGPADLYAIQLMGSSSVTIYLDNTPTTTYTLTADVLGNLTTLSGTDVPAFAEDFHNLLIYGGMAIELDKMEKPQLAAKQEAKFERRLGQLRLYLALSAGKEIYQGKSNQPITTF